MLQRFFSPREWTAQATDVAALLLRLTLGTLMITGHGFMKLQHVLAGEYGFGDPIGIGATPSLFLVLFAEVGCSILLLIGLWTRLAIIPLLFTMLVVIFVVLLPSGAPMERIESALHFLLPYIALFWLGSGQYSVDALLKRKSTMA